MSIAMQHYENSTVGHSVTITPDGGDLKEFQPVVMELRTLEARGLIEIKQAHEESSSGDNLVDLVRYVRLK